MINLEPLLSTDILRSRSDRCMWLMEIVYIVCSSKESLH